MPRFSVYLDSVSNLDYISDEFLNAYIKWVSEGERTSQKPKIIENGLAKLSSSDLRELEKRIKGSWHDGNTVQELRLKVEKFIDENDLGGGNFTPAYIRMNNSPAKNIVAYISYNLRVWWGTPEKKDREMKHTNNVYELDEQIDIMNW